MSPAETLPLPFGRYILEQKLGSGTFAEVYRATDTRLGRTVALKLLKPLLVAAPETLALFEQEARQVSELYHPRIAPLHDFGEENGRYYLVMRFIEGPNLAELIQQRGKLQREEAVRITAEVGEALTYAYSLNLAHGDVKPQNILIHPREGAVLTDFGLARMVEAGSVKGSLGLQGTPTYMAPELWDGLPASPASDQYALACVLVEMLTGEVLFGASTPMAALKRHTQPPNLPQAWLQGTDAWFGKALLQALAKTPQERHISVEAFCRALQPLKLAPAPRVEVVAPPAYPIPPVAHERQTRIREKDGMVEVCIPAGEFLMGSDESDKVAKDDEKPQRRVYLDDYWIDQTLVTNAMFVCFLNERGNQKEDHSNWYYDFFNPIKQNNGVWLVETGLEHHPVVGVTWFGARAYANWVGRKLPTEAQWEKAARGTDGRLYPWGNLEPNHSLVKYNSISGTTPVGSYPSGASPYGLLDMAGNVWEWCQDWFDADYYKKGLRKNPLGSKTGETRVTRGGCWTNMAWSLRSACRDMVGPNVANLRIGFRCAGV